MNINRIQVLKEFLNNLYRISNKEYQERIWIRGTGPECHDFDEAVNDFFGDGNPILERYQVYGLSEIQYRLLKKFRDKFRIFSDNMAKEVLAVFNYLKSSNEKSNDC
jgi:hypothetical protein